MCTEYKPGWILPAGQAHISAFLVNPAEPGSHTDLLLTLPVQSYTYSTCAQLMKDLISAHLFRAVRVYICILPCPWIAH